MLTSKEQLLKDAKTRGYKPEILEKVYRLLDIFNQILLTKENDELRQLLNQHGIEYPNHKSETQESKVNCGVLAPNSPSRKQVTAHAGKRLKSGEALASEENDETNQASQPPICAAARGPPDEVIDHHDDEWSQRLGIEEEDRDQRNWC